MSESESEINRIITLCFNGSNPGIVPYSVEDRGVEKLGDMTDRMNPAVKGERILAPTENCSVTKVLENIEDMGYVLVSAFGQQRLDPKDKRMKRKYYAVRFIFAKREDEKVSEEFRKKRIQILTDLQALLGALWCVRAFSNPFFEKGVEIGGQRAINIDFHARQPLTRPDGAPIKVHGEPIKAACNLHIGKKGITVFS